ncbi:Kinesin-like protein KIN-UA [Cocos nucifera]|nr:Kinesin-like protein KIN-UA [Cocos nucifera]
MASTNYHRASLRSERQIPTARGSVANGSVRTKPTSSKRSVAVGSLRASIDDENADSGRVRVAVRVRPKNTEDFPFDADFTDCVELQPELNRLKLRKNNWSSESYKFDEVFTESASQRRVYEAVSKPVVESILNGYNGTVMAYGQTGTGKTYTVGRLGKDDPSERGIMVRALEDIIANTNANFDFVAVSYLQLYLESVQDLLAPEKTNIPIVEDPKTGEVSLPGASLVEIRDLDHFLELLQIGEANRYAANTKLNTESSRSHAILVVHVRRSLKKKEENDASSLASGSNGDLPSSCMPIVQKSKLLIVDLAGSERIDKSGSEGHMLEEAKFINLSLTSLGKCINALAENSPHIPTRDSKLTRLLRDSFGGTARTSLIITIGPSARHYSETASTIMFGQRARWEESYVGTCYDKLDLFWSKKLRLVGYVDSLQLCRQKILADTTQMYEKKITELLKHLEDKNSHSATLEAQMTEMQQQLNDNQKLLQIKEKVIDELQQEMSQLNKEAESTIQSLEAENNELLLGKEWLNKELKALQEKLLYEEMQRQTLEDDIVKLKNASNDHSTELEIKEKVIDELQQEMSQLNKEAESTIQSLEAENNELLLGKEWLNKELKALQEKLLYEEMQRQTLEDDIVKLKNASNDHSTELEVTVGLSNIIGLLKSEDLDVQIHAVKMIANLAAEDINQEKIVEEGGLDVLLKLLESSENTSIHRVTAGAIANLAMNGMQHKDLRIKVEENGQDKAVKTFPSMATSRLFQALRNWRDRSTFAFMLENYVKGFETAISKHSGVVNSVVRENKLGNILMEWEIYDKKLSFSGLNQDLIMSKGGARLLANIASGTDDPQTLRMVAGAIANLCGNEKLRMMLKEDGGIKALLGMVRSGNNDVIAQIARGMANFAKCESRGIKQDIVCSALAFSEMLGQPIAQITAGYKRGRSLLIEDGALNWMISNSTTFSAPIRRHIELALCHLAQNEDNARDFVSSGGVKELFRISQESSREDMRNLARKALNSNPTFLAETRSV